MSTARDAARIDVVGDAPTYRRSPQAVWRATNSLFVAAIAPGRPITITGSAAVVWHELAEPATLDELVVRVEAMMSAPNLALHVAVRGLVDDLVGRGLVQRL